MRTGRGTLPQTRCGAGSYILQLASVPLTVTVVGAPFGGQRMRLPVLDSTSSTASWWIPGSLTPVNGIKRSAGVIA